MQIHPEKHELTATSSQNNEKEGFPMTENNKSVLISSREHKIGKTTFIVSSYADNSSKKTAQDLIMDMLLSKVRNMREVSV